MTRAALVLALLTAAFPALAGSSLPPVVAPSPIVLQDTYTVATLPAASDNVGRLANISDLGGVGAGGAPGTGLVYSNGACWSRLRAQPATVQQVPLAAVVSVKALAASTVLQLTGSGLTAATRLDITNACPGDVFRVIFPAGLLSALGTFGVTINASVPVAVPALAGAVTGTWADYSLAGGSVVKIAGGQL